MPKFKIIFIENDTTLQKNFLNTFDEDFEIVIADFLEDENEMVEYLLKLGANGFVIDYLFSDTMPKIKYNGLDLYEKISKKMYNFPVIIFTGNEDTIADSLDNPYLIVEKSYLNKPEIFAKKLHKIISEHASKLQEAEQRITQLKRKKEDGFTLTLSEQDDLIKYDNFLEKATIGYNIVPESFKTSDVGTKLDALLKKTDELLAFKKAKP